PDYISALEFPDPKKPGTVVHMGLKLKGLEHIEKMYICRWPDNSNRKWDMPEPLEAINDPKKGTEGDSCVVLYWQYETKMDSKKVRKMGFTYGLGRVTSTGSPPSGEGQLGLLAHGSTRPGGVFTVTALLTKPKKGQKVEIKLPEGLELVSGQSREQTV